MGLSVLKIFLPCKRILAAPANRLAPMTPDIVNFSQNAASKFDISLPVELHSAAISYKKAHPNELVTSILGRVTGKPVMAEFKRVGAAGPESVYEFWAEGEKAGVIDFLAFKNNDDYLEYYHELSKFANTSKYGVDPSQALNCPKVFVKERWALLKDRYKYIGYRLGQLAIETSQKLCGGKVSMEAAYTSHRFHYKMGFRPMNVLSIMGDTAVFNKFYGPQASAVGLDIKDLISKDGKRYEWWKVTEQQIRKAIANQASSTSNLGAIPMYLPEDGIRTWKGRIAQSPIF